MVGAGTAAATGVGTAMAAGATRSTAAAAEAAGVAATAAEPGLGLPAGGGEDCLTMGLKLCPPLVFTITGLEKEERRRGWEEERFQEGMTGREGGGRGGVK